MYGFSIRRDVQNKSKVLLGYADLLYLSDKKLGAQNTISRCAVTGEFIGSGTITVLWMYDRDYFIGRQIEDNWDIISAEPFFVYFA